MNLSFLFRATMRSPVDDITAFEEPEYVVDTSRWWEDFDEKDD